MVATKQIEVDLPCGLFYDLCNIILDLNGTLAVDGKFIDGVVDRLIKISKILNVYILTADTNQTLDDLREQLPQDCKITFHRLESGRGDIQKLAFLDKLGREKTVAIGNGCNDAMMLREAALSICVIGMEGASVEALMASKTVFLNICDALDIFLKKNRMIATLRK